MGNELEFDFNDSIYVTGTLLSEDYYKPSTFEIVCDHSKTKSHLKIGNMVIHNSHHFNWFHRKMWKLLLGFDVENVKGN